VAKEVREFRARLREAFIRPRKGVGGRWGYLKHHVAIFRTHPYLWRPLLTAVLNRGGRAGAKRRSMSVVILRQEGVALRETKIDGGRGEWGETENERGVVETRETRDLANDGITPWVVKGVGARRLMIATRGMKQLTVA